MIIKLNYHTPPFDVNTISIYTSYDISVFTIVSAFPTYNNKLVCDDFVMFCRRMAGVK